MDTGGETAFAGLVRLSTSDEHTGGANPMGSATPAV